MATVTKPIALDESFNTTEVTPRNIADVLAEELGRLGSKTASDVIYDNTESGLTADNVQDALDEINGKIPTVPSVDIQTAVDEFETYNGGILDSLKVSLSPNQDLHGYDSPWVGGASKNIMPLTVENLKAWNTAGTWNGNTYSYGGMDFTILTDDANNVIGIDENGTTSSYPTFKIFSGTLNGSYRLCRNNARSRVYVNGSQVDDGTSDYSFTASGETYEINLFTGAVTLNHQIVKPMLVLSTETDFTFEPYSNICPISGHTEVDVEVGTNKLNPDNIVQGSLTTSALSTRCSTRGNLTIPISVGQTITVSRQSSTINYAVAVTDSNMSVLFDSGWQSGSSYTYLSAYDGYVELVFAQQDGTDITPSNVKSANFMVEFGSTPSPYVPYTKGTYSLTINLGGTYYSGTLDVVTGVFTPDTAFVEYDGSVDETWEIYNTNYWRTSRPSVMPSYNVDFITNSFTPKSGAGTRASIYVGTSYINVYYADVITTESDWRTWLSQNKIQICQHLATPQTIQLSPTMVKALVGENHLSAPLEGQEITESKYKQMFTFDDVIAYIQSLS